jgi:hypothetical protein
MEAPAGDARDCSTFSRLTLWAPAFASRGRMGARLPRCLSARRALPRVLQRQRVRLTSTSFSILW